MVMQCELLGPFICTVVPLLKDTLQTGHPSIKDTFFGSKYCECLSNKDLFFSSEEVSLLEGDYCQVVSFQRSSIMAINR